MPTASVTWLQAQTATPEFYMSSGGLKSDLNGCTEKSLPTEPVSLLSIYFFKERIEGMVSIDALTYFQHWRGADHSK